ncbi:MAG: SDR family NAD(P)-dependent oxidoreductase [bacterium]|nr:SDR family NAD(P)-dependent oxidoreductase [bacterium]
MQQSVVLITGASSGIGRACAQLFAEHGYRLILWSRRTEKLEELRSELMQSGTDVFAQTVDIRDREAVNAAVTSLKSFSDTIDVLINNAGLSRGLEPVHEGVYENWEEMIDTNVKGLLYVTRAITPAMVKQGSGIVINIASIAGFQVYRGGNVYSATKAAVKMLSQSMQVDLNGTGVRTCNIDPGLVETEFSEVRFRGDVERASTVYKGYTPLSGRDVAEAALFAATRPQHVSVQDILITPTDQASATVVNKQL